MSVAVRTGAQGIHNHAGCSACRHPDRTCRCSVQAQGAGAAQASAHNPAANQWEGQGWAKKVLPPLWACRVLKVWAGANVSVPGRGCRHTGVGYAAGEHNGGGCGSTQKNKSGGWHQPSAPRSLCGRKAAARVAASQACSRVQEAGPCWSAARWCGWGTPAGARNEWGGRRGRTQHCTPTRLAGAAVATLCRHTPAGQLPEQGLPAAAAESSPSRHSTNNAARCRRSRRSHGRRHATPCEARPPV